MKVNMTLSHHETLLGDLLASNPVAAARNGVLGAIHDPLTEQTPWLAEAIEEAAAPLLTELGATSVYDAPPALRAREGRPPARVVRALRDPELVEALSAGLWQLGYHGLAREVEQWGPTSSDPSATVALQAEGVAARGTLVEALRVRAREILDAWVELGVQHLPEHRPVDGRTLVTAARVWQVPLVNGEMAPVPSAAAALYANRLGRSVAAVACAKINDALRSGVPHDQELAAIMEPLALLVAVGEAISAPDNDERTRSAALKAGLPVTVRRGGVTDAALDVHFWWSVFSPWGSSERRSAIAVPTAWRLSSAESDALIWVLSGVAVRLAVAASFPVLPGRGGQRLDWGTHQAERLPEWEAGAVSVWSLMQRGRKPHLRTERPVGLLPRLGNAEAWPWRPQATDTLGAVPIAEGRKPGVDHCRGL